MSLTGKTSAALAETVTNDGFWPDLVLGDLIGIYRIPAEYQTELTINELELAVIEINDNLRALKAVVINAGAHATLADYCAADDNDIEINGEYTLIKRYKHAVFCFAKARLLQHFITINRRKIAENEAKESDETEQYWLDESQGAIAALFAHFYPDEPHISTYGAHVSLL